MPTPRLLTALRDHLVTNGIVRDPSVAGALPPFWRDPKLGTAAPGEGQGVEVGPDAVIAAYLVSGLPAGPFESWARWPIVELRYRTRLGYLAEDLDLQVCSVLIDRRDFTMAGLQVVECEQTLALQRLGSDEQGWEHLSQFTFQLYRS